VIFAVPFTPDLQGPQRGMATDPDTPFLPRCTCAWAAAPLSPLKVSFQLSVGFAPVLSVPVKDPVADLGTPVGLGTSWPALRVAFTP
jgi:hypothetical protein